MKTKTKQTIKKILAITGLGLLLTFALGSVAFLGYELAHKPTKANLLAEVESNLKLTTKKNIIYDESNHFLTLTQSEFLNYELWSKFVYDYANENYITLDYETAIATTKFYVTSKATYSQQGLSYTFTTFAFFKYADSYTFTLYFSDSYSSPSSTSSKYIEIDIPLAQLGATNPMLNVRLRTGSSSTPYYNGGLIIQTQSNPVYDYWYAYYESQQSGGDTPVEPTPTPTTQETTKTFVFADQINYHAPYSQDIDSYFVADSTLTQSADISTKTLLENIKFSSGGQEFDTIRARYINAQALYYYTGTNSSSRSVWSANGFASYMWLEYYNSETNKLEIVNTRLTESFNDSTSSGVVQLKGSKWVSAKYRTITFIDQPTEVQITTLSTLNNTSANIGYYNNSDIGLGNAFTLLGQAFTSWAGILSIQVLPNISLGLLIFLPLIVGIIIFIIWVVKR